MILVSPQYLLCTCCMHSMRSILLLESDKFEQIRRTVIHLHIQNQYLITLWVTGSREFCESHDHSDTFLAQKNEMLLIYDSQNENEFCLIVCMYEDKKISVLMVAIHSDSCDIIIALKKIVLIYFKVVVSTSCTSTHLAPRKDPLPELLPPNPSQQASECVLFGSGSTRSIPGVWEY